MQLTHRVLAYLLVLHLISLPMIFRKRQEPTPLLRAAWMGLALGLLQIVWAGWMVTGGFPGVVRSLHQATGILIWVTAVVMTTLARRAAGTSAVAGSVAPAGVPMPMASGTAA